MSRLRYTILKEPKGRIYRDLIECGMRHCDSFSLVLRSEGLYDTAPQVIARLGSHLIAEGETSEWPGTKLFGHTARIYRYRLSGDSAKMISRIAHRLYAWVQPHLPEDPCLYRKDGSPWLITIAHEKDAYLELPEEEKVELISTIPFLRIGSAQT